MVEKCQRKSLGIGFQPERQFRQLHRKPIAVHSIQTVHRDHSSADCQRAGLRDPAGSSLTRAARQISQQQSVRVWQARHALHAVPQPAPTGAHDHQATCVLPPLPRQSPTRRTCGTRHTAHRRDSGTLPPGSVRYLQRDQPPSAPEWPEGSVLRPDCGLQSGAPASHGPGSEQTHAAYSRNRSSCDLRQLARKTALLECPRPTPSASARHQHRGNAQPARPAGPLRALRASAATSATVVIPGSSSSSAS